jgi:molybdopterin-guanine dinucleotide biosynthesis protein A
LPIVQTPNDIIGFMAAAGYVLAGGASSRMGRNKAFLMVGGRTLLEIAAQAVLQASGSVTIIGPPEIYRNLPYPAIPDLRAGAIPAIGPLAGIETALSHTTADWNLIVACDMPGVTAATLRLIVDTAVLHPDAGCVLPESSDGFVEPLCAAYHKRLLPGISVALDAGKRKVTSALPASAIHHMRMTGDPIFQNINTPEEWGELQRSLDR